MTEHRAACTHRDWICFYERAGEFLAHCQRCRQESAWMPSMSYAEANLKITGGFRARLSGATPPEIFTR